MKRLQDMEREEIHAFTVDKGDRIETLERQLKAADELAKVCGDVRNTVKTRIALTAYREARK